MTEFPPGGVSSTQYGIRVNEPHRLRKEKVGDVIELGSDESARFKASNEWLKKVWTGWSGLQRACTTWPDGSSCTGPWVDVTDD